MKLAFSPKIILFFDNTVKSLFAKVICQFFMPIPPGSKSPYLVQLFQVLLDPIVSLDRWPEEYGETFTLGGEKVPPTISFSTPEAIRTIFNAPSNTIGYSQKSELVKSLLGDGSFIFLPEPEHQRQRKLIVPNWHKRYVMKLYELILQP